MIAHLRWTLTSKTLVMNVTMMMMMMMMMTLATLLIMVSLAILSPRASANQTVSLTVSPTKHIFLGS
jgi:hypothetical protein